MHNHKNLHSGNEGHRRVTRDVKLCIGGGLFIAALFSIYVIAVYVFRGAAPFERLGVTLASVVVLYFVAGIAVGALVGLMLPLARATRFGAALVGVVSATIIYAMVKVALEGAISLTMRDAFAILVPALLVGPTVGLAYRRLFAGEQ